MAVTTPGRAPRKRRGILKTLFWIFLPLLVVLLVAYFVGTSTAFIKGFLLPRVSKSMDTEITVSDVAIHPFSSVMFKDLKVQPHGAQTLLTAREMRAHYSLWDIIRGKIKVDEVYLESPLISLVKEPDGTTNLKKVTDHGENTPAKPAPSQKPASPESSQPAQASEKKSKPPQLDIGKLTLKDATFRYFEHLKTGGTNFAEISGLNLTVNNLRNGQTGKLDLTANVQVNNTEPTNGTMQAVIEGNFSFGITSDLQPGAVRGNLRLAAQNTSGAFGDLAGLIAKLNCDIAPTNINQLTLQFQKGNATLGEVRASGPFDIIKHDGKVSVEIANIDKQVLNLAGAAAGIDFGTSTLNSSNLVELTQGATVISAIGQVNANKLALTQKGQTTPTLDLLLGYNVTVNQNDKSALLEKFDLRGVQNQKEFLHSDLSNPMKIAWGTTTPQAGDATLNLSVKDLNLADWKAFADGLSPNGLMSLTLKLLSQQSGKQLTFDLDSKIDNFSANFQSNAIQPIAISMSAHGQAADLTKFSLSEYRFQLAQKGQWLMLATGDGNFDKKANEGSAQFTLEANLPRLVQALGQKDMNVSSGNLTFKSRVAQKNGAQTVVGSLSVNDLTGKLQKSEFARFTTVADLDLQTGDQVFRLRKASGVLQSAGAAAGNFDANGSFDMAKKAGQFNLKLENINQNALQPFVASALGDKKLVSVIINATASGRMDPDAESAVKADLQVAKLIVSDPKNPGQGTPLDVKFQLDGSMNKQVLNLRQSQLTLTPTARAKNQLQLSGKVDMSQTNAIKGALTLAADSLDVSPYYDILEKDSGASKTTTSTAAPGVPQTPSVPSPAPANVPPQEPQAIKLPFQDFVFNLKVGHLYLRELDISDWQTGLKLDQGHVLMNPLQLALNGHTVSGNVDLNLGVPGYQYDVSLKADQIPLAPLANTFSPKFKGAAKGDVFANVQIKGAGVTGASLQKALNGQIAFTFTNAEIRLPEDYKYKRIIDVIGLALQNPDLGRYAVQWVNSS
ncbi:MAG TPA: AsmA family protein, partial [Verrucomicrobiae bacterium]